MYTADNLYKINTSKYLSLLYMFFYSDNQKTVEYEDDIKAILMCVRGCYKANSCTNKFL